ncbi:MAG: lipoyl synthase [Elusimicrobiota bacterium]|jgi:lipoic acid synthetase|nr:lipoyl synthase [Elusimicrobiota bacterium]
MESKKDTFLAHKNENVKNFLRKPEWLRKKKDIFQNHEMKKILHKYNLHTVCENAFCPNITECFKKNTATFMILGDICTRDCKFCGIKKGIPNFESKNKDEAENIIKIIKNLNLGYIVITMVSRDDLEDGGASYFVEIVRNIRKKILYKKNLYIEILTSDFYSRKYKDKTFEFYKKDLKNYIKNFEDAGINVFGHNIETVRKIYKDVRTIAQYDISLNFLRQLKENITNPYILTKTAMILGLGETSQEVEETFWDIKKTGCDIIMLGQYIAPSLKHYQVKKYLKPEEFENYKNLALKIGFKYVEAGSFVRSSYNAKNIFENIRNKLIL